MAAIDLTTPVAELIRESLRRLSIADRIEHAIEFGPKWAKIEGIPASYRSDGDYEVARLASHAVHLRETAAVYATLADVVSRQHPHSPHAAQIRDALAAVGEGN